MARCVAPLAHALCDGVRDYVIETLADSDVVLVVGGTGFLKQGRASCGSGDRTPARRARSRNAGSAVAGDSIYGVAEIALGRRGHALGVNASRPFGSWDDKPLLGAFSRGEDCGDGGS